MGHRFCLSKEHWIECSDTDSDLLQVKYYQLDWYQDLERVTPLFWEYWYKVMHEDLSDEVTLDVHGVKVPMQRAEQYLLSLQGQACKGFYAQCEGEVIGLLLYHLIAGCIVYVRALYLDSRFVGQGIGQQLTDLSAPPKRIKKIIFKTNNKTNPDEEILRFAKERATLLDDEEGFKTWEMKWEK